MPPRRAKKPKIESDNDDDEQMTKPDIVKDDCEEDDWSQSDYPVDIEEASNSEDDGDISQSPQPLASSGPKKYKRRRDRNLTAKRKASAEITRAKHAEKKKLLDAIKLYPCLYDSSHPHNGSKTEAANAYKIIKEETGIARPSKLLQSIKIVYVRIKERLKNEKDGFEIRYPFMEEMAFFESKGGFIRTASDPEKILENKEKELKSKTLNAAIRNDRKLQNDKLLKAVKRYPCIYNPTLRERTDHSEIVKIWNRIKKQTGIKTPSSRFGSLKMAFKQIQEKLKRDPSYVPPKFPHFQQMKFLEGYDLPKAIKKAPIKEDPGTIAMKEINLKMKQDRIAENIKLLDLVKQYPSVYDPKLRSKKAMDIAVIWRKIAEEVGVQQPNKRFVDLRKVYEQRREKLKSGDTKRKLPDFPYMEQMQFLDAVLPENDEPEWPEENFSDSSLSSIDWWAEKTTENNDTIDIAENDTMASVDSRPATPMSLNEASMTENDIPLAEIMVEPAKPSRQRKPKPVYVSKKKQAELLANEMLAKALKDKANRVQEESDILDNVKRHPCIWDPKIRKQMRASDVRKAWVDIAKTTKLKNARRRYDNLKMSYNRIKKRMMEGGDGESIRFVHIQRMQFLDGLSIVWPGEASVNKVEAKTSNASFDESFKPSTNSKPTTIAVSEATPKPTIVDKANPDYSELCCKSIQTFFKACKNTADQIQLYSHVVAAAKAKYNEMNK